MRSYFLTGCTGFVGRALVAEISRRTDTASVMVLTRDPQQHWDFYRDPKVTLYTGNITSGSFPRATQFTDVIHGASEPLDHDDERQRGNYYTVVEGTRRLLDWACRANPRILILSSGAAALADTIYGQAKRMSEFLLRCNTSTGKIARIFSLVSEDTPTQYALGAFARQAALQGLVTVHGGEQARRSYLHVEDAARWLLAILDDGAALYPYDVGGDAAVSVSELADMVGEAFRVPVDHLPPNCAGISYLPNLQAINSLGCKQTISLDKALERIRDKTRIHHPDLEPAKAA